MSTTETETDDETGTCEKCGETSDEVQNGLCEECEGNYCHACEAMTGKTDCQHITELDGEDEVYQGRLGCGCDPSPSPSEEGDVHKAIIKRSLYLLAWTKGRSWLRELWQTMADPLKFEPFRMGSMLGGTVDFSFSGSGATCSAACEDELLAPALGYLWTLDKAAGPQMAWARERIAEIIVWGFPPRIMKLELSEHIGRPDTYHSAKLKPLAQCIAEADPDRALELAFTRRPEGMARAGLEALRAKHGPDYLPFWTHYHALALIDPKGKRPTIIRGLTALQSWTKVWYHGEGKDNPRSYSFRLGPVLDLDQVPSRRDHTDTEPDPVAEWLEKSRKERFKIKTEEQIINNS